MTVLETMRKERSTTAPLLEVSISNVRCDFGLFRAEISFTIESMRLIQKIFPEANHIALRDFVAKLDKAIGLKGDSND